MGFYKEELDGKLIPSMKKFAKHYGVTPQEVQLMMKLNGDKTQFFSCVHYQIREEQSAIHIMQGPKAWMDFSGHFMMLPPIIAKILGRLAQENNIPRERVNVMVVLKEEEVEEGKKLVKKQELYLFLMDGPSKVRLLPDEEVLDDEQITVDQMELMKENK